MQHKSLFAALLCGALCLTACLKNEESPSVTQVRNAKAHELESIAELNKAQATATITLANAQAKLLEAEAKLTEANAKIAEAQAKKVEAETALLVVEAKLREVYVQIAGVELDAKIAELEALKAQYKAEIAAAEAAEAYWQGMKDQVATELEIQAALLEAALINAQAEVAEAAAAYAALLHQIEEDLAQEEREDLADLRDRIAALSDEYTEAALELIEMKGALYEANVMKAGLEAGIIDLQDAKNAKTEKNNNEIARIQKYEEYLETYREASVEEIKDQSVDAIIEYNKASDEWNAAEAEATSLKTAWHELKTQVGYTYENKFAQEGVELYEGSSFEYTLPAIADMMGAQVVFDEETGAKKHVYKYEEIIDEESGETEEKEVVLYTEHITKKTPFTYPELPEGIDHVSPRIMETMSDEERVIYPLTVNKEAYQTIVDQQIAATELFRDNQVEKIQKFIDYFQEFIDYYASPVKQYKDAHDAAVKNVKDTKEAFETAWNAWQKAMRDWGKAHEVENMVEIQALWEEFYALRYEAEAWNYSWKYDTYTYYGLYWAIIDLQDEIDWAAAYMSGDSESIEDYQPIPFSPIVPDYDDITWRELLIQYETAEANVTAAKKAAEQPASDFATAEKKLQKYQKAVDDAEEAVEEAIDALYAARKAAAADPDNQTKQEAVTTAQQDYDDALQAYDDALDDYNDYFDGDYTTYKEANDDAQEDIADAESVRDAYKAAVDYVQNLEANLGAIIEEYQGAMKEYEETSADYAKQLDALVEKWMGFQDWLMQSEEGQAAYQAYLDAQDAWNSYAAAKEELNDMEDLYSRKWVVDYYGFMYWNYMYWSQYYADSFAWDEEEYEILLKYFWTYDYDNLIKNYNGELQLQLFYANCDDLIPYIDYGYPESYPFDPEIFITGEDFFEENLDDAYSKKGYYLSVVALTNASTYYTELIKTLNTEIDNIKEKAADQIARINTIMDLYDDVTATQDVYFEGMEELNNIWAEYVVAKKAAFDKKLVMDEREAECDALHVLLVNTEALDAEIAACEAQIEALKQEIATLEDQIKTSEDLIAIMLNPTIALLEEQIEVYEQLVASLKAELDAALEELNQ